MSIAEFVPAPRIAGNDGGTGRDSCLGSTAHKHCDLVTARQRKRGQRPAEIPGATVHQDGSDTA